jgi:lipopolysaccharide/colanic/teichoic acid biosynthesis glycosyltransferase
VASLVLAVCWLPLLLIAVAVRLESKGSPIYRQIRIGQGGVPFTIYKLRTMFAGVGGSTLTVPGDARVTRLGRILRATCIDEIPQLVNVLLGHMTLVGPRPQTPALAVRYPAHLRTIFQYRPGLTGPGVLRMNDEDVLRADMADPDDYYLREVVPGRVALDLEYLQMPTLRRTLGLMLETLSRAPARFASREPKGAATVVDLRERSEARRAARDESFGPEQLEAVSASD